MGRWMEPKFYTVRRLVQINILTGRGACDEWVVCVSFVPSAMDVPYRSLYRIECFPEALSWASLCLIPRSCTLFVMSACPLYDKLYAKSLE